MYSQRDELPSGDRLRISDFARRKNGDYVSELETSTSTEEEVPSFFTRDTRLREEDAISSCNYVAGPDAFNLVAFPGLRWLALRNSGDQQLPEHLLARARVLAVFRTRGGYLTSLPENLFEQNPSLDAAYLTDNPLTSLPQGLFRDFLEGEVVRFQRLAAAARGYQTYEETVRAAVVTPNAIVVGLTKFTYVGLRRVFESRPVVFRQLGRPLWSQGGTMHLTNGLAFFPRANELVVRIFEAGLVVKWWKDLQRVKAEHGDHEVEEEEAQLLTLDNVQSSFWFLVAGLLTSTIVFVVEVVKKLPLRTVAMK